MLTSCPVFVAVGFSGRITTSCSVCENFDYFARNTLPLHAGQLNNCQTSKRRLTCQVSALIAVIHQAEGRGTL